MDQRRKRVSLTIFQKVEILKKLLHGSSVKMIQEEYNVGKSTIYDLRSDKEKILQYAAVRVSKSNEKQKNNEACQIWWTG